MYMVFFARKERNKYTCIRNEKKMRSRDPHKLLYFPSILFLVRIRTSASCLFDEDLEVQKHKHKKNPWQKRVGENG